MMKMNWTHYSKLLALGVLLAVALSTAGLVAAVSFDDSGVPDEVEVDDEVTINVSANDPFEDKPATWTIEAETDLDDADVTLRSVTVGGDVTTTSGDDGLELSQDDGVNEVHVEVVGTVPAIANWNYDDPDEENVMVLEINDADGPTVDRWEVHRFTEDSKTARQAIDDASETVSEHGDTDAQDRLDEAIVHYNNGEFDRAVNAAEDAEDQALAGGELREMLLIGGGVVLVIGIVGGGVFYWKKRQTDTSKLR